MQLAYQLTHENRATQKKTGQWDANLLKANPKLDDVVAGRRVPT